MSDEKWKCKKHKASDHDIFINYRVRTDKDFAIKLFYALSSETRDDGKAYRPFLDIECLNDGEEWEAGFLHGLESAAVILLLISEDALKGIESAHQHQDNVLLEYEFALEKHKKGQAVILPLLVGKNLDGGLYKPFGAFGLSNYSEQKHASSRALLPSIRGTMEELFKIQGIQTSPDALRDRVKDITAKVSDVLHKFGRIESKQDHHTDVKSWTNKEVLQWLKDSNLTAYEKAFSENAIDGAMLLGLSADELGELGITNKFHLKKIQALIAAQSSSSDNKSPIPTSPPPTPSSPPPQEVKKVESPPPQQPQPQSPTTLQPKNPYSSVHNPYSGVNPYGGGLAQQMAQQQHAMMGSMMGNMMGGGVTGMPSSALQRSRQQQQQPGMQQFGNPFGF